MFDLKTPISFLVMFPLLVLSAIQAQNTDIPLRSWASETARIAERKRIAQTELCLARYRMAKKSPVSVSLNSALWPGLGQFQVKQNTKGSVFAVSSGMIALGAGICYLVSDSAYSSYQNADNIDDIEKYYNRANNFYKYTQYCGIAFGALWVTSMVDAYFSARSYNAKLLSQCFADAGLRPNLQMNGEGALCIGFTKRF